MITSLPGSSYTTSNDTELLTVLLIVLGVIAVIWAVFGWLLYRVGKRLDYRRGWLAWVPIANIWMIAELSGKENPIAWFGAVALLSISSNLNSLIDSEALSGIISLAASVGTVVIMVLLWSAIAERRGKPGWWGILWIVPIANIVILVLLGNKGEETQYVPGYYYAPGYPGQPYQIQGVYYPQAYPMQANPVGTYPAGTYPQQQQPYPPQGYPYPQQYGQPQAPVQDQPEDSGPDEAVGPASSGDPGTGASRGTDGKPPVPRSGWL